MRKSQRSPLLPGLLLTAAAMLPNSGCESAPNPGVEVSTDPTMDTTREGDTVRLDAKKTKK